MEDLDFRARCSSLRMKKSCWRRRIPLKGAKVNCDYEYNGVQFYHGYQAIRGKIEEVHTASTTPP